jgi:membrane protease YdiL (CAAX protease family)
VLTVGAWAIQLVVLALVAPAAGTTLALALGATAGLGLVGTLAARAVPPPVDRQLGLRGFAWTWLGPLVMLLPVVLLVSELDNRIAEVLPRPAALEATRAPAPDAGADAETAPGAAESGAEVRPDAGAQAAPEAPADATGAAPRQDAPPAPPPAPAEEPAGSDPLATLEWALFAVLLRPVLEEFYFRGVVHHAMVSGLGAWRGVAATALLFAAVRGSLGLGSEYAMATLGVQALLDGLLLGCLRLATGSILPGVLFQAGTAGLGLIALVAGDAVPIPGFNTDGGRTPAAFLAPALLSVAAGLFFVLRGVRARDAAPRPPPVSG